MKTSNKDILLQKAQEIQNLLQNNNISSEIDFDSLREYSINLWINNHVLSLYYKPTKNKFTLYSPDPNFLAFISKLKLLNENIISYNGLVDNKRAKKVNTEPIQTNTFHSHINIYVDGSYHKNLVSSAYVILQNDSLIKEEAFKILNPQLIQYRNVTGEIKAIEKALTYAKEKNYDNINLYYDYNGIKEWATGNWKRNNPLTEEYFNFMQKINIKINWIKVKSHSGNYWNDYVDKLAKKVLGIV